MTNQTTPPDVTVDEAAAEMAVSRVLIYRMMKDGRFDAYKIGKNTRIRRSSLDAFRAGNPWTPGNIYGVPRPKQATQ
jgi:excisionase family DNA binding protein